MATTIESSNPSSDDSAARVETTVTALTVHGTLPAGLSGRLAGIGTDSDSGGSGRRALDADDGMIHAVHLHEARAMSYRSRWVMTDAVAKRLGSDPSPGPRNMGPDIVASNIVAFGGSILALGDRSLAYELAGDLNTLRRVDLAGQSRGLAATPKRDPITGDLHVLAVGANGTQAHVVVSSGSFTRTSRPILDAPNRVRDLMTTRDRVVFVTDGFVGVTSRDGEGRITWITTGTDAPDLVHAHDVDDTVVVYAVTPSLDRWTLHPASSTVHRSVLDPTPRRYAHPNDHRGAEPVRYLWATGDETVDKHDLATSTCSRHAFRADCQPGDFVFVADHARRSEADGGWLVGFVHHTSRDETDLVVLDAADIARPAIARVSIPRRLPRGLRSTWISSTTSETRNEGDNH